MDLKASNWIFEEVAKLLDIWANRAMELKGMSQKKPIFKKMFKELAEEGINRDWDQIQKKMSSLRTEYRKMLSKLAQIFLIDLIWQR